MPQKWNYKTENDIKAGALLCPNCCVELQEATVDFEWEGKTIRNVKILRCPACQEENLTSEQLDEAVRQIENNSH